MTCSSQLPASAWPIIEVSTCNSNVKTIRLSTEGLQRGGSACSKDFAFVFRSGEFWCCKFQAAFISPHVSAQLQADCTLNSFILECPDVADQDLVQFLESLVNGFPINLSPPEFLSFRRLCHSLGNTELICLSFSNHADSDSLGLSNVFSRLHGKSILNSFQVISTKLKMKLTFFPDLISLPLSVLFLVHYFD
jgi:hypothetical protein